MVNVTPAQPGKRRPGPPGESGSAHDQQTRSVVHRLGRCPICGYNLRGLPSTHRCPECSWPYDARTRIWRPLKPKAIFAGLIGFIGAIEGLVWFVVGAPPIFGIAIFVGWLGPASYVGWRYYSIYKRGQFVCVGPDGILYRLQEAEAQLIRWEDIAAIHRQRFDKLCRVERIGDQKHIMLQGVFSSSVDAVEFADLANQRLTVQLKTLASEPPPS